MSTEQARIVRLMSRVYSPKLIAFWWRPLPFRRCLGLGRAPSSCWRWAGRTDRPRTVLEQSSGRGSNPADGIVKLLD